MAHRDDRDYIHKEFPKKFARNDFWAQIKRTVNGNPVSEYEIGLIVHQICRHMQLTPSSHLLDLGCGNGALGSRLFPLVAKYTGVDFSPYLLSIANEYFRPNPNICYLEDDAVAFVAKHVPTEAFDKILLYGCISYFSRENTKVLLRNVSLRFRNVTTVFLGNIPDINCAKEFFAAREVDTYEVDNNQSPIGVWWAPEELERIGTEHGFRAQCFRMPSDFYGCRYRFDIVLSRPEEVSPEKTHA